MPKIIYLCRQENEEAQRTFHNLPFTIYNLSFTTNKVVSFIQYHIENRVAYITLNNPQKRNALSPSLITELTLSFNNAQEDPAVKVIVLRANGEVFSAGADLAYLQQLQNNTYNENLTDSQHLMTLFNTMHKLQKVIIAQVEGHAIAGGCGLATICDIVFSTPQAKFGYTEVGIGFVPALVSVFLLRKIGEGNAKDLLLSGRLIDANEAHRIGMINYVVPANAIAQTVDTYAQRLCNNAASEALAHTKQLIANLQNLGFDEGLHYAAEQNATARASESCKKGISAFLNKEKINW